MAEPPLGRRTLLKLFSAMAAYSSGLLKSKAADAISDIPMAHGIPSKQAIFETIEEICSWGIRRPGYPADVKAEKYVVDAFKSFGLTNVRMEPVEFQKWEPTEYSLHIETEAERFEIKCFPLPHSALDVDIETELAIFDESDPGAVKGKVSLHSLTLSNIPATLPAIGGPELEARNKSSKLPLRPEGVVVDPGGSLAQTRQTLPFTKQIHDVMEPSQEAGAIAFIGVLDGHPGNICEYYVPYDGKQRNFPGLWISGSDGKNLQALIKAGAVRVQLSVKASRQTDVGHNVIGELPGPTDDVLLIGSHHDAPWASAVEDASGIALVLAQAEYWAQVPVDQRPHQMHFLLHAGHMVGSPGAVAFIKAHRPLLDRVVLEVHLEHTANEIHQGEHGLEPTGQPETRWFFTSRNPELQRSVKRALSSENMDRSLILAPDIFGIAPPTDGGIYHLHGVPLFNFLTAPFYLFDSLDTPDKIHQPSLDEITRATIRILHDTRGITAKQMREGVHKRQESLR